MDSDETGDNRTIDAHMNHDITRQLLSGPYNPFKARALNQVLESSSGTSRWCRPVIMLSKLSLPTTSTT